MGMRLSFASEEKLRHNEAGASSDKGRAVRSGKNGEQSPGSLGFLEEGAAPGAS